MEIVLKGALYPILTRLEGHPWHLIHFEELLMIFYEKSHFLQQLFLKIIFMQVRRNCLSRLVD